MNEILTVDFRKSTLNLAIDNRTDILINQQLLVQIISCLEVKNIHEIYESIEMMRRETHSMVINSLPIVSET